VPIKIGFIGAGKVGFSLEKYFIQNNIEVTGYFSKTLISSKEAAIFTETIFYSNLEDLVSESDIIFITTLDYEISNLWMRIKILNAKEHKPTVVFINDYNSILNVGNYEKHIEISDKYLSE
jgi:3-hydroxyisobutyrate dehydrogenase-like beta-hydroxyacid dehydrogenase